MPTKVCRLHCLDALSKFALLSHPGKAKEFKKSPAARGQSDRAAADGSFAKRAWSRSHGKGKSQGKGYGKGKRGQQSWYNNWERRAWNGGSW